MSTSVVMPALEMAQETGRLLVWRKQEGDPVSKGEPLMDIETDKAVVEIEAPAAGILAGVRAREGDLVAVGQTIAWILAPGEPVPAEAMAAPTARRTPESAVPLAGAPPPIQSSGGRVAMSPKARRLAAERGVNIASGSGPGGAVVAADLARHELAGPPDADARGAVWAVMAQRMADAWTTVPHFFVSRDLDAAGLLARRAEANASAGAGADISVTDVLVALVARALQKHPRMNASWVDGAPRNNADINVGIATAVEQGVVVPVIAGAGRLALSEIAARRRELLKRVRAGRPQPSDLRGGTFTISNLGMYGVDAFSAIVNPPQAAILAVGRIADRVVARDRAPAIRPMMTVTLSCDHRVIDGARAAAFLADLARLVESEDAREGGRDTTESSGN